MLPSAFRDEVMAPGLQPDNTGPATTKGQAGGMVNGKAKEAEGGDGNVDESLPPLKPGRQVGWIFKSGEVVAIERHKCDIHSAEEAG